MLLAKARYIVNPRPQTPEIQIPGIPALRRTKQQKGRSVIRTGPATCTSHGVSEGIRTPDIQDHNLAL